MTWIPNNNAFSILLEDDKVRENALVIDIVPKRWTRHSGLESAIATHIMSAFQKTHSTNSQPVLTWKLKQHANEEIQHPDFTIKKGGAVFHDSVPLDDTCTISLRNNTLFFPDGTYAPQSPNKVGSFQIYSHHESIKHIESIERSRDSAVKDYDIFTRLKAPYASMALGILSGFGKHGAPLEIHTSRDGLTSMMNQILVALGKTFKNCTKSGLAAESAILDISDGFVKNALSAWLVRPDVAWNTTRYIASPHLDNIIEPIKETLEFQAGHAAMHTLLDHDVTSDMLLGHCSAHEVLFMTSGLQTAIKEGLKILAQNPNLLKPRAMKIATS